MINNIEWISCSFGLMGAFLLATHTRFSKWGWVCFLLSNAGWVLYALTMHANGLLLQQVGFTGTSLLGLKQWWLSKEQKAA